MSERFFPPITNEQLKPFVMIRRLMLADPGYLEDEECPYSDEVRAYLGEVRGSSGGGEDGGLGVGLESFDQEASRLYTELKEFGKTLQAGDTSEKNVYFRLSVTLLDKIISLKERAAGLKQVEEFTATIMQIMEDELPPTLRTNIMRKLNAVIGEGES